MTNTLHFPEQQILDSSKRKDYADNFKFDENDRKFSYRVENIIGNGGIAHLEQFYPFHVIVSKDLYCRHLKS